VASTLGHRVRIDQIADTALADRTAQAPSAQASSIQPEVTPTKRAATVKAKAIAGTESEANDLLIALRADLTSTQKARASLQTQLTDLTTELAGLSTQQATTSAQVSTLTKQKLDAERKLRDRDEELRGKSKLVEQAHDEMVALGLQLNLSEQRSEKLQKENKELVERWMKRMGEEVEKVNRDSKWE
jgi:chromosome segregation ATPase